jgi:hypothetical protein
MPAMSQQTQARHSDDFVRVEIEARLRLGKRVIPVLVNDADMPRGEDLPEPLKPLARRNAVRLTHDRSIQSGAATPGAEEAAVDPCPSQGRARAVPTWQAPRSRQLFAISRPEAANGPLSRDT